MKQKENIFEELNKMRSLIHTRAGVVISEQANPSADAGTIMRELGNVNSDETKIVFHSENLTEDEAFALERELIKKYGRKDNGTGIKKDNFS